MLVLARLPLPLCTPPQSRPRRAPARWPHLGAQRRRLLRQSPSPASRLMRESGPHLGLTHTSAQLDECCSVGSPSLSSAPMKPFLEAPTRKGKEAGTARCRLRSRARLWCCSFAKPMPGSVTRFHFAMPASCAACPATRVSSARQTAHTPQPVLAAHLRPLLKASLHLSHHVAVLRVLGRLHGLRSAAGVHEDVWHAQLCHGGQHLRVKQPACSTCQRWRRRDEGGAMEG